MTSTDLAARLSAGEGEELLSDAKLRRDPRLRGELFALDAFPAGCVAPALGHAVLCELDLLAIGAGSPGLQPHLAECAACAAEEADAKASLADLEAPASTPKIGLCCVYCRDGLEVASAAYCASCLAVHHPECFQEHGTCAAPGCGELQWVRSSAPQPVALGGTSRSRSGWLVAAGVLLTALLGSGAYLGLVSNARDEAQRVRAREAIAARKARNAALRRVAALEQELQLLITQQHYDEARSLLDTSVPLLQTTVADHEELRRLIDLLNLSEADTTRYREAQEIIQNRLVDRYPRAYDHLLGIDPRSQSVYPDARAYLRWLEGERRLKVAKELLASGKDQQAEVLLQQAITSYRADLAGVSSETASTLMSAARSSTKLASRWRSGLDSFRRAEVEIGNDRLERARLDLLTTLEHLPADTPQAKKAKGYLGQLESLRKAKDVRLLYQRRVDGFKLSIKREDWRSADDWATQLAQNHATSTNWVIDLVRETEVKLGLFVAAEKVVADEDAATADLYWARDVVVLLEAWLPPSDPRRVACARHLQALTKRIERSTNAEERKDGENKDKDKGSRR